MSAENDDANRNARREREREKRRNDGIYVQTHLFRSIPIASQTAFLTTSSFLVPPPSPRFFFELFPLRLESSDPSESSSEEDKSRSASLRRLAASVEDEEEEAVRGEGLWVLEEVGRTGRCWEEEEEG